VDVTDDGDVTDVTDDGDVTDDELKTEQYFCYR
jgi:hypothetical protein